MKRFAFWGLVGTCIAAGALGGCATAAIEGAQAAKSEVVIARNMDAANAGDPEAQFKVGEAYCCSLHEGSGLYNTETSVEWLCRSARQGYAPAMLKLGKIYSGDTIDGVRLARRLAAGVAGTSENHSIASVWLQFARERGESDAADRLEDVWNDLSNAERESANQAYGMGLNAPCLWDEVVGSQRAS